MRCIRSISSKLGLPDVADSIKGALINTGDGLKLVALNIDNRADRLEDGERARKGGRIWLPKAAVLEAFEISI